MDSDTTDQGANQQHGNHLEATKRKALEALVGLMPQLNNLDPEQKFKICIDTIRLTDNQALVDAALEAGLAIQDAEARANALLEVVAEINYLQSNQEDNKNPANSAPSP